MASDHYLSGLYAAKIGSVSQFGLGDSSEPMSLSGTNMLVDADSTSIYIAVPEPSTMLLMASALVIVMGAISRRR